MEANGLAVQNEWGLLSCELMTVFSTNIYGLYHDLYFKFICHSANVEYFC